MDRYTRGTHCARPATGSHAGAVCWSRSPEASGETLWTLLGPGEDRLRGAELGGRLRSAGGQGIGAGVGARAHQGRIEARENAGACLVGRRLRRTAGALQRLLIRFGILQELLPFFRAHAGLLEDVGRHELFQLLELEAAELLGEIDIGGGALVVLLDALAPRARRAELLGQALEGIAECGILHLGV